MHQLVQMVITFMFYFCCNLQYLLTCFMRQSRHFKFTKDFYLTPQTNICPLCDIIELANEKMECMHYSCKIPIVHLFNYISVTYLNGEYLSSCNLHICLIYTDLSSNIVSSVFVANQTMSTLKLPLLSGEI